MSNTTDDQMFEVPGSRLRELTDRIAELTAALDRVRALAERGDEAAGVLIRPSQILAALDGDA